MIEEIGLEGNLHFKNDGIIKNKNDDTNMVDAENKSNFQQKKVKSKEKKNKEMQESTIPVDNQNNDDVKLTFGQEIIVRVDFYEDIGEVDTQIIYVKNVEENDSTNVSKSNMNQTNTVQSQSSQNSGNDMLDGINLNQTLQDTSINKEKKKKDKLKRKRN